MTMKQMENMQSHRLPHRVVWSIDDVRKPVRLFYPILIISNSNNIATLPTNINIVAKILSLIKNLEGFANKWQLCCDTCSNGLAHMDIRWAQIKSHVLQWVFCCWKWQLFWWWFWLLVAEQQNWSVKLIGGASQPFCRLTFLPGALLPILIYPTAPILNNSIHQLFPLAQFGDVCSSKGGLPIKLWSE